MSPISDKNNPSEIHGANGEDCCLQFLKEMATISAVATGLKIYMSHGS
jgi:hypothetical protein